MELDAHAFSEQVIAELTVLADPVRAEGEKRYFKATINNLGVTLPQINALEKRLFKDLARKISVDDAMHLCDVLLDHRVFEVTILAMTFLDRFSSRLGLGELTRFREWLERDLLDNWAAVDTLCPHVIGTILKQSPDLAEEVKTWAESPNQWTRRASAVSFILLLRKGLFLDTAYEIADTLLPSTEDLVQKGLGWMLREAGTTDPLRLESYLLCHGPAIPRTSLRYATEKFPPDKRQEILTLTRRAR